MGLLGTDWDDPKSLATMQLAAGLLTPGSFGQAASRGLMGYQASLGAAEDRATQKAYREAQMAQLRSAAEQRMAQVEQARRQLAIRQQIAADIANGQTPNWQGYMLAGLDPKDAAELASAPNLGKTKVARTVKGMGPDGKEYEYQVDEFGNRVGEGMAQYKAPLQTDAGGRVVFSSPYAPGVPIATVGKTMTPDAAASNSLARDRLNFDKEQATLGGKPQPGYELVGTDPATGGAMWRPIKGGPADMKQQGILNQDIAQLNSSTASLDGLATAANQLLNHKGLGGITGLMGSIPNRPGSDAADADAQLGSLKSKVAFGVLQDMRNNSKTGGALGSVSDAEGKRLESNLATLEKAQSEKQMRESLKAIIKYTEAAKDRMREAYNLKHGDAPTQSTSQGNTFDKLPPPQNYKGKVAVGDDGSRYRSNGLQWVKE